MTIVTLYWGLIILNIAAFLTGRKYKLLSLITSVFLILFVMGKRPDGVSRIGADYDFYSIAYENGEFFSVDIGYNIINVFGKSLSVPFETFYMIVVAAIILMLIIAVVKIGGNLHLFLASYLIYFDMLTIDLLRNQCAIAILALSVFATYYKHRKYLPGLALASSFHVSFIAYIVPFYFCEKRGLDKAKKWMIAMLVFFAFFFLTGAINIVKPLLSFLFSFLGSAEERYAEYLNVNAKMSMLLPLFVYLILVVGLKYWKSNCINYSMDKEKSFSADYIYKFTLYCSLFLVLTFISVQCYRFIRDLTLIGIIYMGINSTREFSSFKNRLGVLLFMLAISFGWFYFDVIVKGYYADYVMYFYQNELLNF